MTNPSPDSAGYTGQMGLPDGTDQFNAIQFMIRQALGTVYTATVVRVEAVTLPDEADAMGTVDVLPLVAQVNGAGEPTPHGIIYGVPYMRLQGGANAIIIDPKAGDLGMAVFADRDLSSVKVNKEPANPGSWRRFSMSDALYLGGFLNAVPAQYLKFTGGILAETPALDVTGNLTSGTGATGVFGTPTGQTVTVSGGIITNIS